jgi:hypothetical protein
MFDGAIQHFPGGDGPPQPWPSWLIHLLAIRHINVGPEVEATPPRQAEL